MFARASALFSDPSNLSIDHYDRIGGNGEPESDNLCKYPDKTMTICDEEGRYRTCSDLLQSTACSALLQYLYLLLTTLILPGYKRMV